MLLKNFWKSCTESWSNACCLRNCTTHGKLYHWKWRRNFSQSLQIQIVHHQQNRWRCCFRDPQTWHSTICRSIVLVSSTPKDFQKAYEGEIWLVDRSTARDLTVYHNNLNGTGNTFFLICDKQKNDFNPAGRFKRCAINSRPAAFMLLLLQLCRSLRGPSQYRKYSCNKITTTWIQISCQNWNGLFSNAYSHQIMT